MLARGETDRFAAWRIEAPTGRELLMVVYLGRTNSWLRVEPLSAAETRLPRILSGILS
jgi:hypothetical protein